jgi:hypothetical protein
VPGRGYADALEGQIDSLSLVPRSSVAGQYLAPGFLFTGLTRDDVGGLRYMLRSNNFNIENLPAGTSLVPQLPTLQYVTNVSVYMYTNIIISTNGTTTNVTTTSPWNIYLGTTNYYTTNLFSTNTSIFTNPVWTIYLGFTNTTTTGSSNAVTTNITYYVYTNTTVSSNLVAQTNVMIGTGLRPGMEKLHFRRVNFDSLLGQTFYPQTNYWWDMVVSNYSKIWQHVRRINTQPDILFVAYDLGIDGNGNTPYDDPILTRRGVNYINNDTINGRTRTAGPGNLVPPVLISYTDILPGFMNSTYWGQTMNQTNAYQTVIWGTFGPSMDVPITIFPNALSLQQLEEIVQSQ